MDDAALPFLVELPEETETVGEVTPAAREELARLRVLVGVASVVDGALRLQFRVSTTVERRQWARSGNVDIHLNVLDSQVEHSAVHDVRVPLAGLRSARVRTPWLRAPTLTLEALDLHAFDEVPGAGGVLLKLEFRSEARRALVGLGAELSLRLAEAHAALPAAPPPARAALPR